jgi:hypothetical protein
MADRRRMFLPSLHSVKEWRNGVDIFGNCLSLLKYKNGHV